MALVVLERLNEQGNPSGSVAVSTDHVVAVIGEETDAAVRVVTVAGEFRVAQPQGEGTTSVLKQIRLAN